MPPRRRTAGREPVVAAGLDEVPLREARALLSAGRPREALDALGSRQDREAVLVRAGAQWQSGNGEAARRALTALAPVAGTDADADLLLGHLLWDRQDTAAAADRLAAVAAARPDDPDVLELAGTVLLAAGRVDEARQALRRLEGLRRDARSEHLAGRVALAAGDRSGADRLFVAALAADSGFSPALRGRAEATRVRPGRDPWSAVDSRLAACRSGAGGEREGLSALRTLHAMATGGTLVLAAVVLLLGGLRDDHGAVTVMAVGMFMCLALAGVALSQLLSRKGPAGQLARTRILDRQQRLAVAVWALLPLFPVVWAPVLWALLDDGVRPGWGLPLVVVGALLPPALLAAAAVELRRGRRAAPPHGAWTPWSY